LLLDRHSNAKIFRGLVYLLVRLVDFFAAGSVAANPFLQIDLCAMYNEAWRQNHPLSSDDER